MDLQNLAYALTQVVHNFGAVAVVAGAIYGRAFQNAESSRHRFAWLILIAWSAQAVSGAGFGAISYAYYGQFPDIHGIAVAALIIKMACAFLGFVLAAAMLRAQTHRSDTHQAAVWSVQLALGVVALTAAAFLRWFS